MNEIDLRKAANQYARIVITYDEYPKAAAEAGFISGAQWAYERGRKEAEDKLKPLLEETLDWLCPHAEAIDIKKRHPEFRVWCCDCHNYLRTSEDENLRERIERALLNSNPDQTPVEQSVGEIK